MPFAKNSSDPNLRNIAEEFESWLKKIKQTGEYDEIVNRWLH